MRRHRTNVFGAAIASGVVALVASVSAASATPTTGGDPPCRGAPHPLCLGFF
jgi:hypothetical protein